MFVNVNVSLGKWNGHAFSIKALFNIFIQVKINIPVVRRIDPGTNHKVYAAVRQFGYCNLGCRIFQNAFIRCDEFLQDFLGLIDVVLVTDTKDKITPSGTLG